MTSQVRLAELEGHYEVSIRTPVTPPRWREFDEELAAVWEGLLDALVSADKPRVAVAVLTFVYYWYNFMPLARGTAVCGHITLLSLFAVAGMPLTAAIPVVSPSTGHLAHMIPAERMTGNVVCCEFWRAGGSTPMVKWKVAERRDRKGHTTQCRYERRGCRG